MEKQYTSEDIANRITKLCEKNNHDYITLSRKSGVPLTTILNIVKCNSKNPGIFTILKLCKGLEIAPEDFFIGLKEERKNGSN